MSLEIEKKYRSGDFAATLKKLKKDFGPFTVTKKAGFWWAGNLDNKTPVLEAGGPMILKRDVEHVKEIGEFALPPQDFHYIRLRINNGKDFMITFKTKTLVNNIEQNTEYEFKTDLETFKTIKDYLEENLTVFYFNIKETWKFRKGKVAIELSKLNDLRNAYLEIEILGKNETQLTQELEKALKLFESYSLTEETRNYVDLSRSENKLSLKQVKLGDYSNDAIKELNKILADQMGD